jgi:hypothetical protein
LTLKLHNPTLQPTHSILERDVNGGFSSPVDMCGRLPWLLARSRTPPYADPCGEAGDPESADGKELPHCASLRFPEYGTDGQELRIVCTEEVAA